MSDTPLHHPLTPQEIARRQRWVVVGVTILTILLIGIWITTLPNRLSGGKKGSLFTSIIGEMPEADYIDPNAILQPEVREQERAEMLEAINQILTATSTAETTTSTTAATTTTN